MRMLLSTTALALAMGLPTALLAQSTATPEPAAQSQSGATPGFLSSRAQFDLFASELIGHDVHARRTTTDRDQGQTEPSTDTAMPQGHTDQGRDGTTLHRADLDAMDNIGTINEIVLSYDGRIRAIVIGVGGFLGIGEQDVAVTMDQVTFAFDAEDHTQMHVVVNVGADMLEASPAYDRTAMATDRRDAPTESADRTAHTAAPATDRMAFDRPEMARDGYDRVEVTQVSTEMLMGESVYDVNDTSVGSVDNLIVDDAGEITNVIIDFGGFLGIGSSQVSLNFEELTILANASNDSVRIYVDATREEIRALPQHRPLN